MGMTTNEATRKGIIDHIKKVMKRKDAKAFNWPGAPVAHFDITNGELAAIREMASEGLLTIVERPKANPAYTATFVCLP